MTEYSKRKQVRTVTQTRDLDVRFEQTGPFTNRISLRQPHPLLVIADLRKGRLGSLDEYLAKYQGIYDRELAVELRKLISGSRNRTRYRLAVIDHPDMPKRTGGRPKKKHATATAEERALVKQFTREYKIHGKIWRAKEVLIENGVASEATIDRARRSVKRANVAKLKRIEERLAREAKSIEFGERHRAALQSLEVKGG